MLYFPPSSNSKNGVINLVFYAQPTSTIIPGRTETKTNPSVASYMYLNQN